MNKKLCTAVLVMLTSSGVISTVVTAQDIENINATGMTGNTNSAITQGEGVDNYAGKQTISMGVTDFGDLGDPNDDINGNLAIYHDKVSESVVDRNSQDDAQRVIAKDPDTNGLFIADTVRNTNDPDVEIYTERQQTNDMLTEIAKKGDSYTSIETSANNGIFVKDEKTDNDSQRNGTNITASDVSIDDLENASGKRISLSDLGQVDNINNILKEKIGNQPITVVKAVNEETKQRVDNDIVSGNISAKGNVTMTKGDGSKIEVGQLSDSRLTDVDFSASSGEMTFTVDDKYGNSTETIKVSDIASKTVLENEISQRKEVDNIINNRIGKLDGKMDKIGAGAAALAALHPMDFDADDKLSFAAGVGNYGGETVTALGAFYRPTEKVMLNAAGTIGSGENMVNMGISFALDKPNNVSNTRVAMAQEIIELRAMVAEQGAQIQKLLMLNKLIDAEELAVAMFPDVPENHWAYEYVEGLREQGILKGYEDGYFRGDRMMTRYEFATMLFRALEKGVILDERLANEFKPELGRIRVDRLKGIDTDLDKIERVRVVTSDNHDDYGYKVDLIQ